MPLLPAFIDGLATALSTGFNLEGAVAQASEGVPQGLLRDELQTINQAISNGVPLTEAFSSLKQRICGNEVTSLAVALTLFAGMGGRVLEPFHRLGDKIREQQKIAEKGF